MTPQQDGLLLTATASSRIGFRQSLKGVLSSPRRLRRMILILLGLAAMIGVVAYTGEWFGAELPRFEAWIRSLGWWGPLAYVLVFTVLTFLQLPEMLLAVAAGVAFGLWEGTLIVAFANIFAASLGFFIFRSLLKQRLERLLLRYPKAAAVESAVTAKGLSLMILLRLGPFNFSMLNAVLGASNVRFGPFLLSLVGVIPGNFATVYFGTVARHVAQKSAGVDNLSTAHEIVLVAGFVVTLIVCVFVARVAQHALQEVEAEQAEAAAKASASDSAPAAS